MNINIDSRLHAAFKTAAVSQGKDMTTALVQLIEQYVDRHYPKGLPAELKKKGRRP